MHHFNVHFTWLSGAAREVTCEFKLSFYGRRKEHNLRSTRLLCMEPFLKYLETFGCLSALTVGWYTAVASSEHVVAFFGFCLGCRVNRLLDYQDFLFAYCFVLC